MVQRNVEWFREMARRNVAWYSVHTSLQNIRRSSWTLNCLALHKISRCCGELSSLFMAWRARNHQKYKPQIEQRSAGRHDVIESEVWKCSFYRSLHALVSLNMFIVLSRVMTWIKCRLSSSIFFLDSRLSFNESSTSKTLWTLQEYVRSWILCVPWTPW